MMNSRVRIMPNLGLISSWNLVCIKWMADDGHRQVF